MTDFVSIMVTAMLAEIADSNLWINNLANLVSQLRSWAEEGHETAEWYAASIASMVADELGMTRTNNYSDVLMEEAPYTFGKRVLVYMKKFDATFCVDWNETSRHAAVWQMYRGNEVTHPAIINETAYKIMKSANLYDIIKYEGICASTYNYKAQNVNWDYHY